jgi:RNA polymerase sigma factor (sigma-70 family)
MLPFPRAAGLTHMISPEVAGPETSTIADRAAWFRTTVLPHDSALRAYLRVRFMCVDTDDVVQEAYLRLWRQVTAGRTVHVNVKSYLFTIARNVALDHLRRGARSPFEDRTTHEVYRIPDETIDSGSAAARRQDHELLREALRALPSRCRHAAELRHFQGLNYQEAAKVMQVSPSTINSHVRTAERLCQEYFREKGGL